MNGFLNSIISIVIIQIMKFEKNKKRGRPLGFDRTSALQNAMLTYWQFGYAGTSIADLTEAMGISAQSLYSAFGSKSDLYHEALNFYQNNFCSNMRNALTQQINCLDAIEQMLLEAARLYTDTSHPPGCMIATANLGCASENCTEVVYVSSLRKEANRQIQKRIELGIKAGDLLRSKTNATALAIYLSMLIQGMSVQAQDGATQQHLEEIIHSIKKMLKNAYATD